MPFNQSTSEGHIQVAFAEPIPDRVLEPSHNPRLLSAAIFALLAICCFKLSAEENLIRIGVAESYAPLSDSSTGKPQGYLVDLIELLDAQVDEAIELDDDDWQSLEQKLANREIDALFGLYYSKERAERYSFGPEIFLNRVHFYFRRSAKIRAISEAQGAKVAVAGPDSYLRKFAEDRFPEIEWVVSRDLPEALDLMRKDPSVIGVFEEDALVSYSQNGIRDLNLVKTGAPFIERSLRPVSLRDQPGITRKISRGLDAIDPYAKIRLQATWLGDIETSRSNAAPMLRLTKSEQEFIEGLKNVTVASDSDAPPISSIASDGTHKGILHDVLDLIEDRTGFVFDRIIIKDRDDMLDSLADGRAMLRAGTREEDKSSIGYLSIPLVLVTSDSEATRFNLSAFGGEEVSIAENNPYFAKFSDQYPQITFISVDSDRSGLEDLTHGRVAAHIGDYATCTRLLQASYASELQIVDTLAESLNLSLISSDFAEASQLLEIVNKAIASISEAEASAIYDNWVTAKVQEVVDFTAWWKPISAVAICLLLALLWRLSTLRLRRVLVQSTERLLLAKKAGAGGQFEWFPREERVTYSPEFFEVLGYQPGDLEHNEQTVVNLTHPSDLRRSYYRQVRCTREGKEYEHKMRMQRCDGTWAWIMMRGVPTHFYKDGSVKRYIGVQMDVTDLQKALESQREQQEIARKASKAKSEFLANMSHEIRTPMNAILGFSRLLKRDKTLDGRQMEYVQLINTSSEHLLSLLDSILDMSKIESRHLSLLQSQVNLPHLLNEAAGIFQARCEEKGVHFESSLAENLPSRILGDSTKLRQIIFNLLVNAVKFTDSGTISFKSWVDDGQLFIEVADEGCGIAPDELSKLFVAFQQGKAGQKQSSGTGLGLAISREFSRLMGGDIVASSILDVGSTFTVNIPYEAIEASPDDSDSVTIEIPYQSAAAKRLLIVDDKVSNLQYLERFLGEYGFEIRLASDGNSAIAQWKLYSPDLIILDIRMPIMDGYQVVEKIRKDTIFTQPKILALTASAFDQQRDRILNLGADKFMTKPFDENSLLKTIAALLDLPTTQTITEPSFEKHSSVNTKSFELTLTKRQKEELIAACHGGYLEKIDSIIKELQNDQPSASAELFAIARNFDYERIAKIAEDAELQHPTLN
ncbi:response regulator [Pelagicoccus albus]|uniref:histidine kinase n=1 Tax=Pelagicoccus albus TaxID=415222 RepID=A0A7X1B6M0_9BACT|nr:transporter substrate-binding domain-containing protein [Pelagicoccus albus]MBC2606354.1 transporter substrate-binding domain-containing protein [Pelagicoccus albus]